jgi:small conductance mechanosensitive channel
MTILENFVVGDIFNPTTSLGAIFYGIVFLFLAILAGRTLRLGANQILRRDIHAFVDRTAVSFLTQLAQITVYVLALIFYAHLIPALRSMGTALLTGVSVVSVIIGLAAQNTLGNLIAGISLLLYRPFHVGDRIQVTAPTGLEIGTVESLTLGYTVLQTFDNRRIVVPNSVMATQVTINHTAVNPRQMVLVPIGISYTANIDRARQILLELAQTHPLVQEVVNCPVTQLGDSSVNLSLRAWCANAVEAIQVEFDLYEQAKKRFEQEGIEIPFPYTNIVLKKERQ